MKNATVGFINDDGTLEVIAALNGSARMSEKEFDGLAKVIAKYIKEVHGVKPDILERQDTDWYVDLE